MSGSLRWLQLLLQTEPNLSGECLP